MVKMDVYVQMVLIGINNGALLQIVKEVKFGMEKSVLVRAVIILMELFVYFV